MGARPYSYIVPWQSDIAQALSDLRAEVFARGAYFGAEQGFVTPDEALAMSECGTRSILDITRIAREPAVCTARGLEKDDLEHYFGSHEPTVNDIERASQLWSEIDRGMALYVVAYEHGQPSKIVFMGYSFD